MHVRRLSAPLFLISLLVLPCLLLGLLKGISGDWGGKQPYRTWTDSTGKFSAKARLKTDRGTAIVLERKNGQLVTVPIRRLSVSDRNYLNGENEEAEELFKLSFWKWNYSDPADLWATLVKITPMWVTVAIPLVVTGLGLVFHRQRTAE